jgi:hypothetical protein
VSTVRPVSAKQRPSLLDRHRQIPDRVGHPIRVDVGEVGGQPVQQALDRSVPVLPMMPGIPGRQTHDYLRYGTTSLFAALDVATGTVIGQHQRRHRQQEFLRFLKTIDAHKPPVGPASDL